MARELKRLCNAPAFNPVTLVCGGLLRIWSYADTHIRDDDTLDLSAEELDELIGVEGFCSLMPEDWLRKVDERTVELPGFQAHNGVEARKKALTQKRVATHRKRKGVTESVTPELSTALPDQTRPDHRDTAPKKVANRAIKLPEDFSLDQELQLFATSRLRDVDVGGMLEQFRAYHLAEDSLAKDWRAKWRTWVLNAKAGFKYPKLNGTARHGGGDPYANSI